MEYSCGTISFISCDKKHILCQNHHEFVYQLYIFIKNKRNYLNIKKEMFHKLESKESQPV